MDQGDWREMAEAVYRSSTRRSLRRVAAGKVAHHRRGPRGRTFEADAFSQAPGATHWTVRLAAQASGISKTTVHRLFQAFAVQPHRTRSFKLSNDPFFVEKVRDIAGLYLNLPDHRSFCPSCGGWIPAFRNISRCISLWTFPGHRTSVVTGERLLLQRNHSRLVAGWSANLSRVK